MKGVVHIMERKISYQQILKQQLTIPTKLFSDYKRIGLNETEVMVIVQLFRFQIDGIDFPTPNEITSYLTISEGECRGILLGLIQKGLLNMDELSDESGQLSEAYNLNVLWERLFTEKVNNELVENHESTVFILFEQEFGRLLSPFEIEQINAWLDVDKMNTALIKAALRESVLMGKLNFKYIDRILREWKRKGIVSVEQAREEGKSFRNNQTPVKKAYNSEERDTSVYFDWLEGERK